MPLLGVVQSTGRAGLFLLARGDAQGAEPWRAFDRLLDDATSQFGRVIVALDSTCPAEAAPALGLRPIEGWWAGDGTRTAQGFTERVGIPLHGLDVEVSLGLLLEGLARVAAPAHPGSRHASAGAPEQPTAPADAGPQGAVVGAAFESGVVLPAMQRFERDV